MVLNLLSDICFSGVNDLSKIVLSYFPSKTESIEMQARYGSPLIYEQKGYNVNEAFYGACHGGYIELAELMISKGASDLDGAVCITCQAGHVDLVEVLLSNGANSWSEGSHSLCFKECARSSALVW